ncbi:unnamed protein product [Discula destructiva]
MPLRSSPRKRAAPAANNTEEPAQVERSNGAASKRSAKKPAVAPQKKKNAVATATTPSKKRKAAEQDGGEDEQGHECDSHDEGAGEEEEEEEEEEKIDVKPTPKKRKTKEDKQAEMVPLAARTAISSLPKAMYIGAHVSGAGGVQNSITNAVHIGGNALALFLKSQRKWTSPPLDPSTRDAFHAAAQTHAYLPNRHVLPHGSYLVNLAQADADKAAQAYTNFVDDLHRCDALGIALYNFHPGATGGAPMAAATARIAAQLNRAHAATERVVTVVENMCGHGNVVGGRFEDLAAIIAGVEDKARVGVCLDTCHSFAGGYDLRSPAAFAATMAEFDRVVGLAYLKALHVNDSKAPLGSHRDLHANIGTGFLGLRAFHNVMNFDGFQNMPLVLETPIDERKKDANGKGVEDKQVWADEIKLLEWLIGADPESDEFMEKEKTLSALGEAERKRVQSQVDAKAAKDAKKGGKRGKKKASSDDEEDQ